MDLGDQAHLVKFMIRDRGSNFTGAFDAVLADAGIRTVLCSIQTPRMKPRDCLLHLFWSVGRVVLLLSWWRR